MTTKFLRLPISKDRAVYLNPTHIVAVYSTGGNTAVRTVADIDDDAYWTVRDDLTVEAVVSAIESALSEATSP